MGEMWVARSYLSNSVFLTTIKVYREFRFHIVYQRPNRIV